MEVQGMNKPQIIKRFKRNGHVLSAEAFNNVISYLCSQEEDCLQQKLNDLIERMNELSIVSSNEINEDMIKACIASSNFSRPQVGMKDFMDSKFLQTVFSVSPYEFTLKQVLTEDPPSSLFAFNPAQRAKSYIRKLEKAQNNNKKKQGYVVGLIAQRYDDHYKDLETYVQTYNNQIKLDLSELKSKCPFIIEGSIYVFKGHYKGRDLLFHVTEISLPLPETTPFSFSKKRFTEAHQKAGVTFDNYPQEGVVHKKLSCYGVNYYEDANSEAAVLVLGNVTINTQNVDRISFILANVPTIQCVVLLLSQHTHCNTSLSFGNRAVYVIPSAENDEGPMVFPRIPICKNTFKGATILTNPCKLSLFGANTTFINHRLLRHLSGQTILKGENLKQGQKLKHVGQYLYGQGSMISGSKFYWEQEEYLDISTSQLIMLSDQSIPQGQLNLEKGGNIVSVGHFDRESSFIMYFPRLERNKVQASKL